jgi:two-component system, OmpR family, sensor histidine kinase KdpD
MARLNAGSVTLNCEWQPVEEVVGAALHMLREQLSAHRISVGIAPQMPLLFFDAVLMERVLCNLLENSAKYSPPASEISIEIDTVGSNAVIEVTNTASQFPDPPDSKIFDLFVRGSQNQNVSGSGIGLSICRAIVVAHNGTILAYNDAGKRACVRATIPLGKPPSVELDERLHESMP